jgi:hypothetical protein
MCGIKHCHVYRCVTFKTGFVLDDWIYCTLYIHTVRDYKQYSAIAVLHTLQVTVTHVLGFSVFISRILATDLSQSVTSNMKSSCHRLILLLPFLMNLPSPSYLEYCSLPRPIF